MEADVEADVEGAFSNVSGFFARGADEEVHSCSIPEPPHRYRNPSKVLGLTDFPVTLKGTGTVGAAEDGSGFLAGRAEDVMAVKGSGSRRRRKAFLTRAFARAPPGSRLLTAASKGSRASSSPSGLAQLSILI